LLASGIIPVAIASAPVGTMLVTWFEGKSKIELSAVNAFARHHGFAVVAHPVRVGMSAADVDLALDRTGARRELDDRLRALLAVHRHVHLVGVGARHDVRGRFFD
jgi:hypothetical protein